MPGEKENLRFLRRKRNLILLGLWCFMTIALVAGVTMNAVLYAGDTLKDTDVYHRLWYTLLCFVLMSTPYLAELIFRLRFPLLIEIALPLFAFAALAGGTVFGLYELFPAWDKILHALSGVVFTFAGCLVAELLFRKYPADTRKAVIAAVFALLLALAVNYLWEIYEFIVNAILPGFNNQAADAADTAWDLLSSLLGALAAFVPLLVLLIQSPERLELFTVVKRKKEE